MLTPGPLVGSPDLAALEVLTGTGLAARTASDTWALRTLTGTAAEITVTNGAGVAGNPTLSLPAALTFTGKTVTGGTLSGLTITGGTINNASVGATTPSSGAFTTLVATGTVTGAGLRSTRSVEASGSLLATSASKIALDQVDTDISRIIGLGPDTGTVGNIHLVVASSDASIYSLTATVSGVALTLSNNINLAMSGAATLTTGTGAIALNGDTTIASGKNLAILGIAGIGGAAATFAGLYITTLGGGATFNNGIYVEGSCTVSATNVRGFGAKVNLSAGAAATNTSAFLAQDPTGTGTTVNAYGFYAESIAKGTNNYAIYTNSGQVYFGDEVQVGAGKNLTFLSVGSGIKIKEGTNATMGTATLVAGSVVVSTTKVTATSRIQLTGNSDGGTPGWVRVSARTAGTSFTITSSSGADTGTVGWVIVEPAP